METNLSLMSFKSTLVRTVQYLMACLSSVSYLLVALWVRNIHLSSRTVLRSAFYAAISEGLICDCKMVRPMGFYLRSLKCLWFSQNPGSISNMVLTSVLDCPFLPRDLITGIPCRPHGVVEMLHIKTICAQQNSIKMESVIICVLQKSMVLPLEVRNTLHISPTSISNF